MKFQEFLDETGKSGKVTLKKNYSVSCAENCTLELREGDEINVESGEIYGKLGIKHRVEIKMGEVSTESNMPPGVMYKVNSEGNVQIPYYYDNDSRYLGGFFKGDLQIQPVYHDVLRIGLYVEKPASAVKGKRKVSPRIKGVKVEMPATPEGHISFNKVSDPYGWLSNMSKHTVEKGGKTWRSAEALFQSMRFVNNPELQESIFNQTNPMGVKFIAKKKDNIALMSVKPGSEEDYKNMVEVLGLKLAQHDELKNELLATADNILFLNSFSVKDREPESLFWGAYVENSVLSGENRMGKIWMELRDQLKK